MIQVTKINSRNCEKCGADVSQCVCRATPATDAAHDEIASKFGKSAALSYMADFARRMEQPKADKSKITEADLDRFIETGAAAKQEALLIQRQRLTELRFALERWFSQDTAAPPHEWLEVGRLVREACKNMWSDFRIQTP